MRNDNCDYLYSEWGYTHADDCIACLPISPRTLAQRRRNFFSDLFVGSFLIFALAASVWMVAK